MEPEKEKTEVRPKTALEKNYEKIVVEYESFFQLANQGDISGIYRNRPCFVNETSVENLVKPAIEVFNDFPAARQSVYHYTGMLIHECVHHWFTAKEKLPLTTNITTVKEATCQLLDFYTNFFTEGAGKSSLEECLQFLCELSAELSLRNAGRPAMIHAQQSGEVLSILKSIDIIEKVLSLMNMILSSALNENSEGCMKVLFESSRHGQHFSWIWLHIATFLQGTIITHLLESGAEQFKTYVIEISTRLNAQTTGPAVLNIIQTEYEHKFRAISDVFNFLMGKRNPQLQEAVSQLILDSLDSKPERVGGEKPATTSSRLGFAFFFKLVTCSIKTLQILVTNNCHLITPFNVVRAIRHVQAVDKSLILPAITYTDFIKQIVGDVDPVTHGMIFELLIELIYQHDVFEGENLPEYQEANQNIGRDCFPVLDVMINQLVRIAHSSGAFKCPSMHPAIQLFSSGEKLQFIIDSITRHLEKSPTIIRHLHAISIAFHETKAAEIALRFIMTIRFTEPNYLYIFMSYLSATVPFYPKLMETMWREFSSLKMLIENSFDAEDLEKQNKTKIHLNILYNIRQLLEWEFTTEPSEREPIRPYAYWKLYPGQYVGAVLNSLLGETNKLCWELMEKNKSGDAMAVLRATDKFLESIREASGPLRRGKPIKNSRRLIITVSQMYKLMTQFAIMLKSTLFLVTKDNLSGLVVFEELRSQFLCFLFGKHLDTGLAQLSPLFVNFFVTACFIDSKKLFNEELGEQMESLIDESGLQKLFDNVQLEDGPSVLEGLKSLKMRDTAVNMLHRGQLKKRRGNEQSGKYIEVNEDATQRIYAVLDAIRLMCSSGDHKIQITCSRQLANALMQVVCKDSLMTDMRFDDWDSEAEYIHRHVEITQRLAQSPFCDGILRILSETRSFALCLPIMKSKLAILLNETEKFPEHRTIPEPLRQKLHNWMMLAQKGNILNARLLYIVDLERFATCHETYLMLLEIWRFLMYRNISREIIDAYHADLLRNVVDEGLPNERDAMEKVNISVFRIIIQNHLPGTVQLFPKFFPLEYEFMMMNIMEPQ
ncbi:hypothetical protein GCK72_022038 [Caenorhabditis remanei]|uniref:Uncharacterized protein n=1 Tax=Caenorhabditis remanei TaxID=31234 RepID=A0A6A5GMC1_CAERE|nr:hypothetical protein GCK72_022038 [Caenorhabditis remanei]KAF1755469.1 hypothetical protein GCK72_022038 [Caenorhabditis remanei]